MDQYRSFADLAAGEVDGVDYRIETIWRGALLVMAPHGGEIEPGTSAVARAIAGGDRSVFVFEGLKPHRPHRDLHIVSELYDVPQAVDMALAARGIVAVHGRADKQDGVTDEVTTWVGGRAEAGKRAVVLALEAAGFRAHVAEARLAGRHADNICNRGNGGAGVQLELPLSLRRRLVADARLLANYAMAVRRASE